MCGRAGRDGVAAMSSELGFLRACGRASGKGRGGSGSAVRRLAAGGLAADAIADAEQVAGVVGVRGFAGTEYEQAVAEDAAKQSLSRWDERVSHHEVVADVRQPQVER